MRSPTGAGLVLLVVGGVEVRRGRGELAGAGVHRLVGRPDAERVALGADLGLLDAPQVAELAVGEARAASSGAGASARASAPAGPVPRRRPLALRLDQLRHLVQEPGIDAGSRSAIASTDAPSQQRALDLEDPLGRRACGAPRGPSRATSSCSRSSAGVGPDDPAGPVDLEPAEPLLERLLERAADRHHLADRLHLGGERRDRRWGTSRTRSAGSSPPRSRAPARTRRAWSW